MFIQTEATPNPDTLKFLPGKVVLPKGTFEARNLGEAAHSPLAGRLLTIPGVTGVFYGYDFISVSKSDSEWQHLKPAILGSIMEFFLSGAPLISGDAAESDQDGDEFFDAKDSETVETIKELLDTRVRPAVASDGGDITFRGYRDGVVYLTMKGACSGCPSSTATLKHGIQNLLRHYLPDVEAVEAV
jgi:Thioredoxin-like proteins and domains